jgi:hypothetical protein
MSGREIEDCLHLAADAGIMHCDDGLGSRRHQCFETRLVEIERIWTNVGEHWTRTSKYECIHNGDERKRRNDHLVSFAHVRSNAAISSACVHEVVRSA